MDLPPPSSEQGTSMDLPPPSSEQDASMDLPPPSSEQDTSMDLPPPSTEQDTSMDLPPPSTEQDTSMDLPPPSTEQDASMDLPPPSSEQAQDVSHVLASIFKDAYTKEVIGKDTVSNLSKTKRGISDYHEEYVEELEQIHREYGQRMEHNDMLERHLLQARVRASETQDKARLLGGEGGLYDGLGLPSVRSTLVWCVDNHLLKANHLIGPQDYHPRQGQPSRAPEVKPCLDYAKPTFSHSMHVCREPKEEGHAALSRPRAQPGSVPQEGSERSGTLESSLDLVDLKRKSHSVQSSRGSEQSPSEAKRVMPLSGRNLVEDLDGLRKLKERQNFLRNPRFLPPHMNSLVRPRSRAETGPLQGDSTLSPLSTTDESVPVFQAYPRVVLFTEYTVGQVYETSVELKNLTASCRHVRVLPPTTSYFSIGLGRFPGEGGMVAPGMSCKYMVRFAPDSLGDYEDCLVVETQAPYPMVVPLVARRPPPILTLPRVLDCGYSLVGALKFVEYLCCNEGLSAGTFCVIPRSQWPASNLRSVVMTSFAEEPPFAVGPSLFQLQPGQATVLEVVFFPTAAESYSQDFTVVCDNCQVKDITVQGEGQTIALELISVSGENTLPVVGEARDLSAEHFVRFPSCHPQCVERRAVVIRNNTDLDLPFFWQIMRPNLQWLLPGEEANPDRILFHPAADLVFNVSPLIGCLAPRQDQEFEFTYLPKELKDHHSVCQLVVRDVPQCPNESSDNGAPKISDVIVMEIEVKGSTEPYHLRLEPCAIIHPGELFMGTPTRMGLKMWNHSKSSVLFHWKRMDDSHTLEVEPCWGELEVESCVELDLVVTGGRPGRLVTSLLCHIEHQQQPLRLPVEVCFKGPSLTLSEPSLDLGLLRLGEESRTTVLLNNTSPLEAFWSLDGGGPGGTEDQPPQLVVEPCRGLLAPQASCSVEVVFRGRACRHFEALLELSVEQGSGCYLSVQADVQTPQVCLVSPELAFSEIYMGVPARGVVVLFNQTLLPAHFTWMPQLQGKQAALCTASFQPPSGTLAPHATLEVTAEFTTHTESEVRGVTALCRVHGMDLPVVLGFISKAKPLSVSYSVPGQSSSSPDGHAAPLLLDFGDDVVLRREVTLQMAITNHSAIAAPFKVEARYFKAHAPASSGSNSQSQKGFKYRKKPLHSVQARKLELKAHEDLTEDLLSGGRGAAFLARPGSGTLASFETRLVDVTAYSDAWGRYRDHLVCTVDGLRPRLIPVQMRVSGCPLYFQMSGPRPEDQHQGPTLQFGTHLSGGDTVSRCLRIINPSPYDVRLDWETYNVDAQNLDPHNVDPQRERKLLDMVVAYGDSFPLKDADGNQLVGGALALPNNNVQSLWQRERTPSSERTSSSLQSEPDVVGDHSPTTEEAVVGEEEEEEEEGACSPQRQKRKLFSVYIRPHKGILSDYPYCITPQQVVVPAKGSATVHVAFTPLSLSWDLGQATCRGLALGFMSLEPRAACVPGKVQRAQGLDLEPVRVDLQAVVRAALLSVETDADHHGGLQFDVSADDLLQGESASQMCVRDFEVGQMLVLRNPLEMPLSFRLGTQPPFSVLHPQPRPRTSSSSNPPTSDGSPLLLQPQQNLKVKVSFHCSLALLEQSHLKEAPPTSVSLVSPVSPIRRGSEKRTLIFRQKLHIQYSNNSLQVVPLCARLAVSGLRLSRDSVDFGMCYVGRTQLAHVTLLSHGTCTYWRASLESSEADSHAFSVTPESGVLRGPDPALTRGQQHLEVCFTASEAREFRATLTIHGALIQPSLKLRLWGRGGYDEALGSSLGSY
ncbi:deleted in lung and esophageal cancer protein 1 isoform X2 [Gadus macrocephalus]|uniref:deleted in lung and esophageal cancer protein 1 isoform X2 n=1 Tax=Gadus macrocephalus TaxID=80720 RepID=UPI0028CB9E7C|nr:deleted in lung and esophageal cancer protein 1 isoform X2 [Gadus macrocephalus]